MPEFEKYNHHGKEVWVDKELKGTYREHCLCFNCKRFNIEDRDDNCTRANLLFALAVRLDMVFPIFECPEFIEL